MYQTAAAAVTFSLFLSFFPSPSRLREKKPGGQNMDIMETRFTDSLSFFPFSTILYLRFLRLLFLILSLSPLFIRRRRPLCLVVRKRSRTERCRVSLSLSRPEPRSFLSLLETTTTTTTTEGGRERERKREKLWCVPGRFDPTSVRSPAVQCAHGATRFPY